MAATLTMAFFQALGIASILPFINMIMEPSIINENRWLWWAYNTLGFTSIHSFIMFSGIMMLAIILTGNAISAFATWVKLRFVWQKNHSLSSSLLRKYLSLPYGYFLGHHSADLSKNILDEANELTRSFLIPILSIVTQGTVVFFIFIMLLFVNPVVTFIVAGVLVGSYVLIYLKLSKRLSRGGRSRLAANKERFTAANEALGGIKDIKVMGRELHFLDRYIVNSKKFSNLQSWNEVVGQLPRYAMEVVAFGGVIILILGLLSVAEETQEVIPLVSFFAFAGYRLMPALQEIFKAFTKVQFSKAVLHKIHQDIMEEGGRDLEEYRDINSTKPLAFEKEIELTNIAFSYPGIKEKVLQDISVRIQRNTSIAIVGSTGSGKTTLVDIILGLLTPQAGEIRVDGVLVNEDNMRNWQRNLGYVPQQIYLNDDTIAHNIAFGVPHAEIDIEAVQRTARIANLEKFIIEDLPQGFDSVVGERGVRLSGGERQRVGIARALYHDPEVLILDEATSALDGITEDSVMHAIEKISKLKTIIVIAHRLTTVKKCHKIYMMDKGEIIAQGSYEELIESNPQFRAMAAGTASSNI
ncbi:ABC transporter ATP-binding protein [Candidatus Contubernalis alkalaceticus]|nr:ABC transporter ATP-binding protein [Candidatus Contubernalis alkalaceticus]